MKNSEEKINFENSRREAWMRAWAAKAGTVCMHEDATRWADICLSEFDKRFKNKSVSK